MTVASTFVPQQSDPAATDARRQEPSMEDILASIRRIIADDQTQAPRSGNGESGLAPTPVAAPDLEPGMVANGTPAADRSRPRFRSDYKDMLDLSSMPAPGARDRVTSVYEEQPVLAADEPGSETEPEAERDEGSSIPAAYESVQEDGMMMPEPAVEHRGAPLAPPHLRPSRSEEPSFQGSAKAGDRLPVLPVGEHDDQLAPVEDDSEAGEALISPVLGASVMSAFETLAATVMLQNTDMLERIMRELLRPMVKHWLDENLPTLVERLVRTEIERVARGGRG